MPNFEPGWIVRVPFPYVDKERRHYRPALVISRPVGPDGALFWALMITAAENEGWPGDIPIEAAFDVTGLPIPSVVRTAKVATVETGLASQIGTMPVAIWRKVEAKLERVGVK